LLSGVVIIFADDVDGQNPPLQVFNANPLAPPCFPKPEENCPSFPPSGQ